jgi:hypothetical protein
MYVVCALFKAASELGPDDDAYNRQACSKMIIVAIFDMRINKGRQ